MSNLTDLAFPLVEPMKGVACISCGFTKHELGAFMIAQGLVAKHNLKSPEDQTIIAQLSKQLSAEILNQFT